jgi:hypothetical protein
MSWGQTTYLGASVFPWFRMQASLLKAGSTIVRKVLNPTNSKAQGQVELKVKGNYHQNEQYYLAGCDTL